MFREISPFDHELVSLFVRKSGFGDLGQGTACLLLSKVRMDKSDGKEFTPSLIGLLPHCLTVIVFRPALCMTTGFRISPSSLETLRVILATALFILNLFGKGDRG